MHPPWLTEAIRTLPAEVAAALAGARVMRVEVRQRLPAVTLHLEVQQRVPLSHRPAVAAAIQQALLPELTAVQFTLVLTLARAPFGVPVADLVAAAWDEVKQLAKARLPRLNGTLDQATVGVAEDRVELTFPSDIVRGVVEQAGGRAILEALLRQETGLQVRVALLTPPPAAPDPAPETPAESPGAADLFDVADSERPWPDEPPPEDPHEELVQQMLSEQRAREASAELRGEKPGSGLTSATPGGVVRGRRIDPDEAARPLASITGDEPGKVLIAGEICHVESRETRSGRILVQFAVTDYTDTLVCKVFCGPDDDALEQLLRPGSGVRVRGRVQYDTFSKDYNVMAEDITLTELPRRRDGAAEKRVELHLHTRMSAMDGLVNVAAAIRRAVEWGHAAIAVTDHGVSQSFPDAAHVKVPEGFKVIYGMEAYVVDDGTPVVARAPAGVTLAEAEFVVLDIETTGFSAIGDDIIEIGAVRVSGGQVGERYQTFVRPQKPISREVQQLTHITPDMVADAPEPAEALAAFFDWVGPRAVLVAHNATFDYSFLRYHREKHTGVDLNLPVLDTLTLARSLLTHLKRYGLADLCKELGIPLDNHHRADADAHTAALLLLRLLSHVQEQHPDITEVVHLNRLTRLINVEQLRPHHATVLVQRQAGMQNLYRCISRSHTEYFNRTPRLPRTVLEEHREGLLVGSGCANGALFQALLRGVPDAELEALAGWYDFLEVQPPALYQHLVDAGQLAGPEQVQALIRRIHALGERLGKPVVATGDVHFLDPHEQVFRQILKAGIGWRDDADVPCYFRTTDEMLADFDFLGPDVAHEIVVKNPVRIADMIDQVQPIPRTLFAPRLDGADEAVRDLTWAKLKRVYGDPVPSRIAERVEKELAAIIGGGFAVVYYISHLLVKRSVDLGYLVGSRGSVGSSVVAWGMDITEVNALPPHYVCPDCHYVEWFADGSVGSGYDLPAKPCPQCGREQLCRDGQDIPFETFMGFDGTKTPDIDLNFSGDVQARIQQYSIELLGGPEQVFKAGTVGTIAEKTAYGMVRNWAEETGRTLREGEISRLVRGIEGVKRTTGQHPGGMVVVPVGLEVEAVTPVQFPADDKHSGWKTTHYDYHSFEDALLKLDILGHDDPTTLRMLADLTGVDVRSIPMDDPQVLALFRPREGAAALGLKPEQLDFEGLGTVAVPEFGTGFVRRMLLETRPRQFSDLVRISGLSHGTDVWTNNAQDLIARGLCTLQTVIPTRDDIMVRLMYWGIEPLMAFKIMESVRKGKGLTSEMEDAMKGAGVPDWYIWSCQRIKYMFPKAHAVAYCISSVRIAWFKVHYPREFYAAYLTVRTGGAVDGDLLVRGGDAIRRHMDEIRAKGREASPKEKASLTEYELVLEAMARGITFVRADLAASDAVQYRILPDGRLRLPFASLQGVGESAARAIVLAREEAPFQSVEDLKNRARLNKAVIDCLQAHGCLAGLPEGNQLQFAF